MMKEAEEQSKWQGRGNEHRQTQGEVYHSPADEGRQIRNLHYGQTMAGLLQF